MNVLEQLKKGVLWSLLARIFGAGTGFLITMLLARMLTIETLGIYYLLLNVLRFGSHFIKAGMEVSLQKVFGISINDKNWKQVTAHLLAAGCIVLLTSLFALVIMEVSWKYVANHVLNTPMLAPFATLIFLLLVFRSIEELGSAFFRGVHEPRVGAFLLDGPRQFVMTVLLAIIYISQQSITLPAAIDNYFVSSLSAVLFIILIIAVWGYRRNLHHHWPGFGAIKNQTRNDFNLSFPMMVQGISALITSTFDIWVLGIFASKGDVAIYGTVVRVTSLIMLVMSVSSMVYPPILASLYAKNDKAGIERVMQIVTSGSALIIGPLLLVFWLGGSTLLGAMFGEQFKSGYGMLCFLSIAYAYNALSGSPGWLLQMAGQQKLLMRTSVIIGILNMSGNVIAAKLWGAQGVAVVTALSLMGQDTVNAYFCYKKLNIKTWLNPLSLPKIITTEILSRAKKYAPNNPQ